MSANMIMIVDDDEDFLKEIQETLSLSGYDTIAVDNSKAALDVAAKVKPDVILLDIKMKGMYGFQVAERLKKAPETACIPIIAMTGCFRGQEDTRFMGTWGMEMCLEKPFNPLDLISGIEKVLKNVKGTYPLASNHIN